MTPLEKFFLGLTLVFLALVVVLNGIPVEFLSCFIPLSIFIVIRVVKERTARKARAKGVIRVYRESEDYGFVVKREFPDFPRTKDDYACLHTAMKRMEEWLDNHGQYPVFFYFQGYYTLVADESDFQNQFEKIYSKLKELS